MSRKLVLKAVLILAPSLVALGITPAHAENIPINGVKDSVIVYENISSLSGAILKTNKGVKVGDGCAFELSGEGVSDDTVEYVQEVSYDPSTCTQTIARSIYPKTKVPKEIQRISLEKITSDMKSETQIGSIVSITHDDPIVKAAPAKTYKRQLEATIKDPVNLLTTATGTSLTWTASSTAVSSYSAKHANAWLNASGWIRTSNRDTQGKSGNVVYGDTTANFANATFCRVITLGLSNSPTYASHSKTRVEGKAGGAWTWSYSMKKSGGCENMLHYSFTAS